MLVKDYSHQKKAVNDIINIFEKEPLARVLLRMDTGTGKTIVARLLLIDDRLKEALLKNKERKTLRLIYKCHVGRLITQARRRFDMEKMTEVSMDHWIANEESDNGIEIIFQMYGDKLPEGVDIDLIMYDECQHEACTTIQSFLSTAGKFPSVGMSATPERSDNFLIKFDHKVEPITREEAVAGGFICQPDIRTVVDTSSTDKTKLLKKLLKCFYKDMGQTMIFVRTKAEINQVVDFINSNDFDGSAIGVGVSNDEDLDQILDDFGIGEYKYIVSCKKLSEGIDIPNVTDVIIAKNVGSYIDLNQMIGRAARPDNPKCFVWEFINALNDNNLESDTVVGLPKSHHLISIHNNKFIVRDFMENKIINTIDIE